MKLILYFYTLPVLTYVAYLQYCNWKEFRYEGNGANLERFTLMLGSIAAIGTTASLLFENIAFASIFVSLVPIVGLVLYRVQSKKLIGKK